MFHIMNAYLKKLDGIFFEESEMTIGTGHTTKTQKVKNYCHAQQTDEDAVKVAYLGDDGQPTGIEMVVPYEDFLRRFTLDPGFRVKSSEERQTDKHIAKAEKHRARGEHFSAEWEYTNALKVDQDNIRANFGIGTLYMEMGERDKAKKVFQKLTQIEAIFEEENKHIFNEFGIELRKAEMYDEALANYLKALEISPEDENLYFNVARLYYDQGEVLKSCEFLDKALSVNPHFRDAQQFRDHVRHKLDH